MKQIIIISEDRAGVAAEISEAMAAAGVNIETLSAETVGGSAVTIMTVDKYDEGLRALAQTPFHAISEDAIVVQLDDRPGELARIMRRFKEANINLHSVRIIRRDPAAGKSIVAVGTERTAEAMKLLKDVLVSNFTRDQG
ncbi:MAG: ACT domain-containing protein [Pirellulales bacterium]|nr:ACT domain-containing protein [Pirellulales bacterium]